MKLRFEPTIPNYLTTVRLAAIPFMAWFIYAGERYNTIAFIFFVSIWATDMLDGYIARHYNMISNFGKIYDPFVDKVFQFTTATTLFITHRLPLWVPVFIFLKEAMMIVGGFFLLKKRKTIIQARWYGKLATVLFVACFAVLFVLPSDKQQWAQYIFIIPVGWALVAYLLYGIRFMIPHLRHKKPAA
ncbi:MAG: CDP-alcohol phosphatidyltransferase family protein [Eubacteriales bacterium]|nr:CDP-alcohol phosphatidyltransferase family protein [Eubacteriales bacterium]